MTCAEVKFMLSAYLDGAITGRQMYGLDQHLRVCAGCWRDYESLRRTQALLSKLGRARAPEDLSLKVRLALSREAARRRRPVWASLALRLQNALRAFMVPATAGVFATIVIFAVLMGFITPVQFNSSDVPLLISTGPELQQTAFGVSLGAVGDEALVIEAYVDANGRIQDYRILSEPDKLQDLPHQIKNMLIFTTFRPATWMGSPRPGTAVLSFSKISVRG
ncbi:MAG: zf-HC2 domain-containing protein [Acidobacteria bacterium]|nr:zf-HC2 domain-containing protein [Acidobacteriota bacterium]MBV9625377.1 zf-HC2 domain-containing protein [Acidobacteriota bacterium]